MIVVMEPGASNQLIEDVVGALKGYGFDVHRSTGVNQTVPSYDVTEVKDPV